MTTSTSLTLALLLSVPACGATTAPLDASPPSLAGHWRSSCVPQPQADGSKLYATLDFTIAAATWSVDYVLHADASCAAQLVTIAIRGPYELGAPSATMAGAREARFGFSDKTITPHAQPIVDALAHAGCGTGMWAIDATQSVFAAGCAAFGQYPEADCPADYDLVANDGHTLRFGQRPADNNMCTPAHRPAQLSALVMTRVP